MGGAPRAEHGRSLSYKDIAQEQVDYEKAKQGIVQTNTDIAKLRQRQRLAAS